MKLKKLNSLHFMLAGVIAATIALFVYMWLDTRNLKRSTTPEAVSVSQAPTLGSDGTAAARYAIKTGSPVQRNDMKHAELVKASEDFFRRQADTPAAGSNADDWMFERGKNVEAEPADTGNISVPE